MDGNLESDSPFVRRLTAARKPATRLRRETREAVDRFLASGYREAPNPCLCGGSDDRLIARRDRFGIPLDTRLCTNCGLMRSDPYMDDESIEQFYGGIYRDIYTSGWLELTPVESFESQRWAGLEIRRWLTSKGFAAPELVFEIGCGGGGILQVFSDWGSRVVGCDFDERYLAEGRRAGLELERGSAETLSSHGRADLVILSHVLEHLRDPISILREVPQLLKPTGQLYVEVPGVLEIRKAYKTLDSFLVNAHVWHFSLRTLDYVLGLAGFERVHGDEFIRSVYRYAPRGETAPDGTAFEEILAYLKRTERLRFLPRLTNPVLSLAPMARRLMGRRLYRRASRLYARGTRGRG